MLNYSSLLSVELFFTHYFATTSQIYREHNESNDDDDTYNDAAHHSGGLLSILIQRLLLHHHTLVAAVLRSLSITDLLYILLIFLGRSSIGLAGAIVAQLGIIADETGA